MKLTYTALLTLLFTAFIPAYAGENLKLQIIYPANGAKINASSAFIVGNTNPEACLTINDRQGKVRPNGAFVEMVSLQEGTNKIGIKASTLTESKEIDYILYVNKKTSAPAQNTFRPASFAARVKSDYAVTRTAPGKDRLTPLPRGTVIAVTGKIGDSYRFRYSDLREGWISKHDIKHLFKKTSPPNAALTSVNADSDEHYVCIKAALSKKIPFIIDEVSPSEIKLKLYGVISGIDNIPPEKTCGFMKEIRLDRESKDCFSLSIKTACNNFWGYKYYYEGKNLVLRFRKPPETNPLYPLAGKIICLDAGHGGKELGSVGPTAVAEKTVNLAIAKNLKEILEAKGAKVIMTRDSDRYVELYHRVKIANAQNAQIIISIHNNALPDGKNPYEEHGTTAYYYHPQSVPLAESIQDSLVQTLGFKNLGVNHGSFVLTRPTEAPSVLVEVGFMINPDEYSLLITPEFQQKAAMGIAKGLENYLLK